METAHGHSRATVIEALGPLRRKAELEMAMRVPGVVRVRAERELFDWLALLEQVPDATKIILEASENLRLPVLRLSAEDISRRAG